MPKPITHLPQWPARLLTLLRGLSTHADDPLRGEAWSLLTTALHAKLLHQSALLGRVDPAVLEDIAAEKALDLFRRVESGTWDVTGRGPAELSGFLDRTARNGLVDHFRRHGRHLNLEDAAQLDTLDADAATGRRDATAASGPAEGAEFARALAECVGKLKERARAIWIFRVFYEMSSKEIARHPEIGITPGNVDVILQRSREALSDCMHRKGLSAEDLPPGAFAEIWSVFRDLGHDGERTDDER